MKEWWWYVNKQEELPEELNERKVKHTARMLKTTKAEYKDNGETLNYGRLCICRMIVH